MKVHRLHHDIRLHASVRVYGVGVYEKLILHMSILNFKRNLNGNKRYSSQGNQ